MRVGGESGCAGHAAVPAFGAAARVLLLVQQLLDVARGHRRCPFYFSVVLNLGHADLAVGRGARTPGLILHSQLDTHTLRLVLSFPPIY